MAKVTSTEASTMAVSLGTTIAVGLAHTTALVYAANNLDGNVKYLYGALIAAQSLGLLALTVGQGAALFVAKDEARKEKAAARRVAGTRDFLTRPL